MSAGVLFVDSEVTPGIKLGDFCAHIPRVYYERALDRQELRGDPYLVRQKTFDWKDDDGRNRGESGRWGRNTSSTEIVCAPTLKGREPVAAPGF